MLRGLSSIYRNWLMSELQVGDIVLVRSKGGIARAIRWRTRSKGESPTVINHVGLITRISPEPYITEALLIDGVKEHPLEVAYRDREDEYAIARPLGLTEIKRERIHQSAKHMVGLRYGWRKILLQLIGLGWLAWGRRSPICSWLVARAYVEGAEWDFGAKRGWRNTTPDDIWDFIEAHLGEKYVYVKHPPGEWYEFLGD